MRPKYYVLRGDTVFSVISLRNEVDQCTAALLNEKKETEDEIERWKRYSYPLSLYSFEAYGIAVVGAFMGIDQQTDGPAKPFVLETKTGSAPGTKLMFYETLRDLRAGFETLLEHYKRDPIAAEAKKNKYEQMAAQKEEMDRMISKYRDIYYGAKGKGNW